MESLKMIFKKQGGMKLIKQYWLCGCLFTAIGQFLLLGKSKTALELLRLAINLKTKQKLQKKYKRKLNEFDRLYDFTLTHEVSNKVWVCWFQGMENAPELVKKCYQSLQENLTSKEIILITSENLEDYVQFPEFIMEKWKNGQITNTHMTDLLRLELLIKYGGMWVDATVLCTSKEHEIPNYYFESDLFFFQTLKPGKDGHSHICSSWLINAKTNNKILMAVQNLCYEYWKRNTVMADYFLLHDFLAITLDFYKEDWNNIVPVDNSTPHILLLRLFQQYDEEMFKSIKEQTPFHKLSYKFSNEQLKASGTYYNVIFTIKH